MKKTTIYLLLPLIILSVLACNTSTKEEPTATTTDDAMEKEKAKSFIDSINVQFSEEIKRGDSVALAAHYSADAELIFGNNEPAKGKDILSAWGSTIDMGLKDAKFTSTDIVVNAGLLVETGFFEMFGDKGFVMGRGDYVVVWKKENGAWKLYRDMGNTRMSAGENKQKM